MLSSSVIVIPRAIADELAITDEERDKLEAASHPLIDALAKAESDGGSDVAVALAWLASWRRGQKIQDEAAAAEAASSRDSEEPASSLGFDEKIESILENAAGDDEKINPKKEGMPLRSVLAICREHLKDRFRLALELDKNSFWDLGDHLRVLWSFELLLSHGSFYEALSILGKYGQLVWDCHINVYRIEINNNMVSIRGIVYD